MLRADYDNHPLWETLRQVDTGLESIVSDNIPEEAPLIERIRVQQKYLRSFDVVASTRAAFFHPDMLNRVDSAWSSVLGGINNRVSTGVGNISYLATAADAAEAGLNEMGPWPRQYGKGGEVTQMNTLFEDLLEVQRKSIETLARRHEELLAEIEEYESRVDAKREEAAGRLDEVKNEVARLEGQIDADRSTVETAVTDSAKAVANLTKVNDEAFSTWKTERENAFKAEFNPLRDEIATRLADAQREYDELLSAKESYQKLVSAIAADEVASRFEGEARWGRRAGVALYILGFALLAGAALPLVFLLFDHKVEAATDINWSRIIIRVGIGVLAGSAATVAIRLGSRLVNSANAVKRMELELRAIGPFLANVAERDKVDDARIELVNRAFGKAYTDNPDAKTKSGEDSGKDDAVPVSTLSQVVDIAQRIVKQ